MFLVVHTLYLDHHERLRECYLTSYMNDARSVVCTSLGKISARKIKAENESCMLNIRKSLVVYLRLVVER